MFPNADCLHFALYYFRLYSEPRSRAQWMRDSTHSTPPPRIVALSPWYLLGPGPVKQSSTGCSAYLITLLTLPILLG